LYALIILYFAQNLHDFNFIETGHRKGPESQVNETARKSDDFGCIGRTDLMASHVIGM
jgi:hypothetical protein